MKDDLSCDDVLATLFGQSYILSIKWLLKKYISLYTFSLFVCLSKDIDRLPLNVLSVSIQNPLVSITIQRFCDFKKKWVSIFKVLCNDWKGQSFGNDKTCHSRCTWQPIQRLLALSMCFNFAPLIAMVTSRKPLYAVTISCKGLII